MLSISVVEIAFKFEYVIYVFFVSNQMKKTGHTIEGSSLLLSTPKTICNPTNYLIKTEMCMRKSLFALTPNQKKKQQQH